MGTNFNGPSELLQGVDMNLQEFLFTLTFVFFTTGFITWLRVTVERIAKGSDINKSTAESLKLYRNESK